MHFIKKPAKVTRRGIQITLGLFWFLDGVLQLQPQMFTANFTTDVIAPASQGQPSFVSGPMHFFMHLFLLQPILFNLLIALTQLGVGILILWKRTVNIGLWCSVVWGLFVWYIGEGFSGLVSGHALLLMGAPGAALLYVLLAVGIRPPRSDRKIGGSRRPAYWLLIAWVTLWTIGSVYQLLPGQNTIADVSTMISTNASSAPSWMASLDNSTVNMLNHIGTATVPMDGMPQMTPGEMAAMPTRAVSGLWFLLFLSAIQLVIGFAVIIPGLTRWFAVISGSILATIYWVIGQSMGSYFSGLATDPNSGPLFILLGIAVLGCTQHDENVRRYFRRIKKSFIAEMQAFNES